MNPGEADPDLLRTFLAVRRHRNLTRAAEEQFLSQPAVSRRIQRLERALGLPLFERLGKAIHPTEAGEALAREAESLIGSAERLVEVVRAHKVGEEGRLRVGASTTPGLHLLPRVVVRFRERWPKVDVHYTVENSLRIQDRIVRNDIDLGFVGAHLTHGDVALRPVYRDEIVLYAAASHPLARRRALAPRDLEHELCFVRESGSATRRLVDAWARRSRVRLSRTVEVGCPEAARVLVRSGLGFSYASRIGLRGEAGRDLRILPVATFRVTRPLFLVRHADKRMSRPMAAFLRECAGVLDVPPDASA
jgi:DNA-binding transcriptional LysR family regulator